MSRIQHTVTEILNRFKVSDPPQNFEEFGPLKNSLCLYPYLSKSNNNYNQSKKQQKYGQNSNEKTFNKKFTFQKQPQTSVLTENFAPQPVVSNDLPQNSTFNPQKIQNENSNFVPDFSEPPRVETFDSIINSDPKLPPGFNAKPVSNDELPFSSQNKQETTQTATFEKVFEPGLLSRADQAVNYYNPNLNQQKD